MGSSGKKTKSGGKSGAGGGAAKNAPKSKPAASGAATAAAGAHHPAHAQGAATIDYVHPPTPETIGGLLRLASAPLREFMNEPLPRGVNFFQTTGSLCLFMAMVQFVTGILMAFYYTPTPEAAWETVNFVRERVAFGSIIHGLHHWGASGFVVAAALHVLRVFVFGAYKGRRALTWIVGVGLFGVVLAFGFTGYLLPWDMKGYFGTVVGTSIVGYAPVVGEPLKRFLLGGPELTELTLPRFYAIHTMLLPAALVALVGAHLWLVRLHGITPPWKRDDEKTDYPFRFFPDQALRDSLVMLLALLVLLLLVFTVGGNLEPKADPTDGSYAPHPEWYFLGLQQILHYFQGDLQIVGTVVIPMGTGLLMLLLPFIDRNPERRISKRPIAMTVAVFAVASVVTLTTLGWRQLEREREHRRQMAAAEAAAEAEEAGAETAEGEGPDAAAAGAGAGAAGATATAYVFDENAARMGAELYERLKCDSCHVGEDVGHGLNIPPSLEFAGDRFRPEWIVEYMHAVPLRRYERKGRRSAMRMPDYRLNVNERVAIAAYLDTKRKPELFEHLVFDEAGSTPEKVALGEELFEAEGCGVCHMLDGHGGRTAPDLTGVGSTLRSRFLFAVIKETQNLIPDTTMMDSHLPDDEIAALAYFLMEKKAPATPEGGGAE